VTRALIASSHRWALISSFEFFERWLRHTLSYMWRSACERARADLGLKREQKKPQQKRGKKHE